MCESGPRPGLCWRIRAVREVNPLHYSTLKKNVKLLMSFEKPLRFHGRYAQQLNSQYWEGIQYISMIKA